MTEAERPPFDRRLAPRPLGFHLMMSAGTWLGGAAAWPAFRDGHLPIHPDLQEEAEGLRQAMAARPLGVDAAAAAQGRIAAMLAGVRRYQEHPHRRTLTDPPALFTRGSCRLRDFAPEAKGPTIIAVPSLINPAHILDLDEGASLMRYLASQGFRPMLLDWGSPKDAERDFGLDEYVLDRLIPAIRAAVDAVGTQVSLLGYCMGGNLAIAAALHRPDLVRGLALVATPWDFHAEGVILTRALTHLMSGSLALLPQGSVVPLDLLQIFFASIDPTLSDRKFRRFARLSAMSEAARRFVVMEDWANDGPPLARKVAEQCLQDWYGRNLPAEGNWQVGGLAIRPERLEIPALVALPQSDRIVPPASAAAIIPLLRDSRVVHARAGHVAMVAGTGAESSLWQPLATWLSHPQR